MSSQEITQLRQAGELDKAYEMATIELQSNPDNVWCKRALGWVLYDKIKACIEAQSVQNTIEYLRQIQNLAFSADETMLYESLCWQVLRLSYLIPDEDASKWMPEIDSIVRTFCPTKPSAAYSALLKAMMHHSDKWDGFVSFYQWWDDANYLKEDYFPTQYNGKEMKPLVEKCVGACAKLLYTKNYSKEEVESFIETMRGLIPQYADRYTFLRYYCSKLLLKVGNHKEALEVILPFVRLKQKEFWAWDYLADIFEGSEDKLSCSCKAVLCGGKEAMLVGVHFKLAELFAERNMLEEANNELNAVISTRTKNNWNIPYPILKMKQSDWFRKSEYVFNRGLYNHYSVHAEQLLFNDIPEREIIATYINNEKKIVSFVTLDTKNGFLSLKGKEQLMPNIKIGTPLSVRIVEIQEDKPVKCFTIKVLSSPNDTAKLIRPYSGQLHINHTLLFGIVMSNGEKVFIPSNFIKQFGIVDKTYVNGEMIPSFDRKNRVWGNTAISIFKTSN